MLLTPNERGLNVDCSLYPCSMTGSFAGHNCASFAEDATAAGKAVSSYLENPYYTQQAVATNGFNTAPRVAGNNNAAACIALLQNAYTATGRYLANA